MTEKPQDVSRSDDDSPDEDAVHGEEVNEDSTESDEESAAEDETAAPQDPEEPAAEEGNTAANAQSEEKQNEGDEGLPEWEPLAPELVEDEAIRGDFMLRAMVLFLAFLLGCTAIYETTTFVHLKTGQYIAQNGWLPPRTDVFSYTASDRPWINLAWLFDLALAGVYNVGSATGLSVFKALLAAVTFFFVGRCVRKDVPTWWGSVCAGVALLVCYSQFTALPECVTLLGLAVTLWALNRWQETGSDRRLWALVPIFLVWSNLDPRMFLGLALLLLYAVGDAVGNLLGRGSLADAGQRKQLWMVIAGCVLASLVNPFGWHSLTAASTLYGVEYPALRAHLQQPTLEYLPFFPMTELRFWDPVSPQSVAGLLLAGIAIVVFVLRWPKIDYGHSFVLLGFSGFAAVASHELAAAGLVACVVATLNAQDWYRESFSQAYSVKTSELLFSRGGRAITVLAFFGIAFWAVSGRLDTPDGRRTGVGIDENLQANIDGLKSDCEDSLDDRPFTFRFEQGDLLIWIGKEVFVDSRVALYHGRGDDNLLEKHDKTRNSMRARRPQLPGTGNEKIWQATFDEYGITHAVARLSGPVPAYPVYFEMLLAPRDSREPNFWHLTRLGPSSAILYRNEPKTEKYVAEHRENFADRAFKEKVAESAERPAFAREPTFYEKYLTLPRTKLPNPVRQALHYHEHLRRALQRQIPLEPGMQLGLAYLAIRSLNQALADDPQQAEAYRILGSIYEFLSLVESQIAGASGVEYREPIRFYQAVQAYNQSLLVDPQSRFTHIQLRTLYVSHGKIDLALQALDEYERLAEGRRLTESEIKVQVENSDLRKRLVTAVENVKSEVAKAIENEADPLSIAMSAYGAGCVLEALRILEGETDPASQTAQGQLFKGVLMMEAGRSEEAYSLLTTLERDVRELGGRDWRPKVALSNLSDANYMHAIKLWRDEAAEIEIQGMRQLFQTLPFVIPPSRWPTFQTQSLSTNLFRNPQAGGALQYKIAVCLLEAGKNEQAAEAFQKLIEVDPETLLRPLVRYYLFQITGEDLIDFVPPSDRIPITSDLFADDEPSGPRTGETNNLDRKPAVAEKPIQD